MARTPLTLAALATAAVPGLEVARAAWHTTGRGGQFDSVLLETPGGHRVIIRVPADQSAETAQSADLVALQALTSGVRSRLPFDIPTALGQTPFEGTRAVVYEFAPGRPVTLDDVRGDLAVSVGRAIGAIHSLPGGFVAEAGLPQQTADEAREEAMATVDRAAGTGQLPAALRTRWTTAISDSSLWRFQPTVVNGELGAESLLVEGDRVAAVIGWQALAVGDPARDLAWLMGAHPDDAGDAIEAYRRVRQLPEEQLTQRALLHAELDLARWLLHGHELHDRATIDDAVALLDDLVDRLHTNELDPLRAVTGPILTVSQVQRLLDSTPGATENAGLGLAPVAEDPEPRYEESTDASVLDDGADETSVFDPDSTAPIDIPATADHRATNSSSE